MLRAARTGNGRHDYEWLWRKICGAPAAPLRVDGLRRAIRRECEVPADRMTDAMVPAALSSRTSDACCRSRSPRLVAA